MHQSMGSLRKSFHPSVNQHLPVISQLGTCLHYPSITAGKLNDLVLCRLRRYSYLMGVPACDRHGISRRPRFTAFLPVLLLHVLSLLSPWCSLALGTGCNDDIKGPLELNTHKASFSCFVYEDLEFGRFLVFCSALCSFKRIIKVWVGTQW